MPLALEELWRVARRLDAEAFAARHPHPFLVRLDESRAPVDPDEPTFQGPFPTHARPVPIPDAAPVPRVGPLARALEVIKCSGKGARDTISVGRSKDNDVVVQARSISQRHASLITQGPQRWQLRDEGSRNGVRLNGSRLAAGAMVAVRSGDILSLGDVPLVFVLPADLLDLIPHLCGPM